MIAEIRKESDDQLMVIFKGTWMFDFLWEVPRGALKIGYQPYHLHYRHIPMIEDEEI